MTLTIPKDGYTVDLVTGAFKAEDLAVQADLAHPERPTTAIGYLVAALDRRRRTGLAPFSVLSCATTAVMSDTDSTPRGEQGQSLASRLSTPDSRKLLGRPDMAISWPETPPAMAKRPCSCL